MPLGFSQLGPAILTINYLPSLHHPWNAAPPLEKLENQIKWSDKLVNTPSWLSLFKVLQCTLKEKRKKLLPTMLYFLPTCYTPCLTILNFIYIYIFFNSFLFIWLHRVLAVVCGIQFPNQGSNPGPQHWEMRVLATGPPGQSLNFIFLFTLFLKILL